MRWKLLAAAAVVWIAAAAPVESQTQFTADGVIESTAGGFKFPDGSSQMSAAVAGSVPVEDSGQALCHDSAGATRNCAGTGEDGELRPGVAWPTPRFTDNGNGTVTDNLTGLNWLKDANCRMEMAAATGTWQSALDWVNTTLDSTTCAGYTAGTFTDWRLPTVKDLLSLIDRSRSAPAFPIPNPFMNVAVNYYWSSTTDPGNLAQAWVVGIGLCFVRPMDKTTATENIFTWAVRGGH